MCNGKLFDGSEKIIKNYYSKVYSGNFKSCFCIDTHKYNPCPRSLLKKLYKINYAQRYSMPVYLRLTEYFYFKYKKKHCKIYKILSDICKRRNEVYNNFEHGYEHDIAPGTLFHHTGITLSKGTRIRSNVQIFKNVTLAMVNGYVTEVEENSILFSHVIVLGRKIGKNCVIGAGSVVKNDIPDNSIVAGVPARIIGKCEDSKVYLEYQ